MSTALCVLCCVLRRWVGVGLVTPRGVYVRLMGWWSVVNMNDGKQVESCEGLGQSRAREFVVVSLRTTTAARPACLSGFCTCCVYLWHCAWGGVGW